MFSDPEGPEFEPCRTTSAGSADATDRLGLRYHALAGRVVTFLMNQAVWLVNWFQAHRAEQRLFEGTPCAEPVQRLRDVFFAALDSVSGLLAQSLRREHHPAMLMEGSRQRADGKLCDRLTAPSTLHTRGHRGPPSPASCGPSRLTIGVLMGLRQRENLCDVIAAGTVAVLDPERYGLTKVVERHSDLRG